MRKTIKVTENDAEYEFIPETMIVARMGRSINQQTFFFFRLNFKPFLKNSSCLCHSHFYFYLWSLQLFSYLNGTWKKSPEKFSSIGFLHFHPKQFYKHSHKHKENCPGWCLTDAETIDWKMKTSVKERGGGGNSHLLMNFILFTVFFSIIGYVSIEYIF